MNCPKCLGTGFYQSEICSCITGKKDPDLPPGFKDIFGDIFSGKYDPENAEDAETCKKK